MAYVFVPLGALVLIAVLSFLVSINCIDIFLNQRNLQGTVYSEKIALV